MRWLPAVLLGLVGIIHLLPVTGILGASSLQRLYGVAITDPNLLILMQHRAVLFAIVGGLLIASVVKPDWRPLAIMVGLISVVSFLAIAWGVGGYNPLIARVVWIDVAALLALAVAAAVGASAKGNDSG